INQTFSGNNKSEAFDIQIFPDLNGKYRITTTAAGKQCNPILGCGSEQAGGQVSRNVILAVPPVVPTGAKGTITDTGKVTIQWDANNKEGDLLGYEVDKADTHGVYKCMVVVAVDPKAP